MYLELFKANKKKVILLNGEPKITATSVEDIDSDGQSEQILSMLSSGTNPDAYWKDEDDNLWDGFNVCTGIPDPDDFLKDSNPNEQSEFVNPDVLHCKKCGADLTVKDNVTRRYINKDEGDDKFSSGHYDKTTGDYEPYCKADLSNGRYDLVDNSDTCTNCGEVVG